MSSVSVEPQAPAGPPTLWEIFVSFLVIGAVSFGGGIIAYEKILLTEKNAGFLMTSSWRPWPLVKPCRV